MANNGRPRKHTDEELLLMLQDYVQNNNNKTIKYGELEKTYGVDRHIWQKRLKSEIEEINDSYRVTTQDLGLMLPSIEEIMLSCGTDLEKFQEQFEWYHDIILDLYKYKKYEKTIKKLEKEHKAKIDELNCVIEDQKNTIDKLYDNINDYILESNNPKICKEKGIKNNIIELTDENLELFKEMSNNLLL